MTFGQKEGALTDWMAPSAAVPIPKAGVAVDERGYVVVDDQLRTCVPGIWALGDCNGKGAFTHTAYNDGGTMPLQQRCPPGSLPLRPARIHGVGEALKSRTHDRPCGTVAGGRE